jgi:hypothetical protein
VRAAKPTLRSQSQWSSRLEAGADPVAAEGGGFAKFLLYVEEKMNDRFDNGGHRLAGHAWLGLFELVGFKVMLLQQVVEVSAILTGQLSRMTDVAFGQR